MPALIYLSDKKVDSFDEDWRLDLMQKASQLLSHAIIPVVWSKQDDDLSHKKIKEL